jgi:hypothetical protein
MGCRPHLLPTFPWWGVRHGLLGTLGLLTTFGAPAWLSDIATASLHSWIYAWAASHERDVVDEQIARRATAGGLVAAGLSQVVLRRVVEQAQGLVEFALELLDQRLFRLLLSAYRAGLWRTCGETVGGYSSGTSRLFAGRVSDMRPSTTTPEAKVKAATVVTANGSPTTSASTPASRPPTA